MYPIFHIINFGDDSMKTYKPYRHQLRRSLFASTIFPVFMVMIIGLISFYAIYIWVEHRTIHQHTYQTQTELQRIDKHFHTFVTQQQNNGVMLIYHIQLISQR